MEKEDKISFMTDRKTDRNNKIKTNYDDDLVYAERARNTQYTDSDPRVEKEGFLGMDDLDRMRRRHIKKFY